jgi:hypothetical protein
MPRHFAIDANVVGGTVSIQGVKTVDVLFKDQDGNPVLFTLAPRVAITITSQNSIAPFKVKNNKVGSLFSGFTLGFPSNVTIEFEWQAFERT